MEGPLKTFDEALQAVIRSGSSIDKDKEAIKQLNAIGQRYNCLFDEVCSSEGVQVLVSRAFYEHDDPDKALMEMFMHGLIVGMEMEKNESS